MSGSIPDLVRPQRLADAIHFSAMQFLVLSQKLDNSNSTQLNAATLQKPGALIALGFFIFELSPVI